MGMHWFQTGATQYHAQLGLPDKGRVIRVGCNKGDLEPLDLQNGLALGCYQPSPEVLIVLFLKLLYRSYFLLDRRNVHNTFSVQWLNVKWFAPIISEAKTQ